jgi:hypothetical protein
MAIDQWQLTIGRYYGDDFHGVLPTYILKEIPAVPALTVLNT